MKHPREYPKQSNWAWWKFTGPCISMAGSQAHGLLGKVFNPIHWTTFITTTTTTTMVFSMVVCRSMHPQDQVLIVKVIIFEQ